jgi:hypothetical protein
MPQVPQVDGMAGYAEAGEEDWEAIDKREEELDEDCGIDEASEDFARENGVLFY